MGKTIKQGQSVLWVQEGGPGTTLKPFAVGEDGASMTGKTIPVKGVTPVYGRDRFNNPVVVDLTETAPGDLPSATVTIYEKKTLTFLENMVQKQCPINMQLRAVECGVLDDPFIWDKMQHWGQGILTTYNPGDGPAIEYDNTIMQAAGTLSFRHVLLLAQLELSSLVNAEVEDALSIAGIPDEDCNRCGFGYPGADQVLYVGAAGGAAGGNVLYSGNGGGAWAATTAPPFVTVAEQPAFIAVRPFGRDGARVICGNDVTDAASKAKYAYADVTWGDLDVAAWTGGVIDGTSTADFLEAMAWLLHDRLLFASSGDIYVSVNQGNTTPDAAIFVGANAIAGFTISPDNRDIWAFGATNTILREVDQDGVFAARVGPAGGAAFTALVVAGDGTIYAGNGTSVFKSTDNAGSAGNWTELYDFGGTMVVVELQVVGGIRAGGGDSQILRAVVDDPTPGTSSIWLSFDGGQNWEDVTQILNDGYNAAYFSQIDDNKVIIVGDNDGSFAAIHQLEPA